ALPAALFPMAQQIAIQHAGPTRAAFEEGYVQAREAAGHATEKHSLAGGMVGGGEMADVVKGKVRWRGAQPGAAMAAVEGRRNAELEAFRPDGVVIVLAVEPDDVVPHRETGGLALELAGGFDRPIHQAAEH